MSDTVTIKLEDKTGQALHRLAELTGRSVDDLVNQAILHHLELLEWQRRKIEAGIAAADRAEFATEEELARVTSKYSMPKCPPESERRATDYPTHPRSNPDLG